MSEQAVFDGHALITGAGSGIGAAIALALAKSGMKLTLLGRRLAPLETTIKACQEAGSDLASLRAISCDVTDETSVVSAFAAASKNFGPVNVLVNCAGAAPTSPFHKLSATDWKRVIDLNLNGTFLCTAQVIKAMRELRRGRIINIASTASQRGYAYVSAYCAAKHGVLGLTRSLALETAGMDITVNAICPGYTDTDIIRDSVKLIVEKTGRSEADALKEFTKTNPQGRLIDPEEVAHTVLWLCADESRSITGQAISVSGGEVM